MSGWFLYKSNAVWKVQFNQYGDRFSNLLLVPLPSIGLKSRTVSRQASNFMDQWQGSITHSHHLRQATRFRTTWHEEEVTSSVEFQSKFDIKSDIC